MYCYALTLWNGYISNQIIKINRKNKCLKVYIHARIAKDSLLYKGLYCTRKNYILPPTGRLYPDCSLSKVSGSPWLWPRTELSLGLPTGNPWALNLTQDIPRINNMAWVPLCILCARGSKNPGLWSS